MRRKDRQRTDAAFFDAVFAASDVVFLALKNGDAPYCLPVNFAYEHTRDWARLYIHCAHEGLKLDCVRADPHVAFSCATDIRIDRENASTYFKSVCGTGLAQVVEDLAEKCHALDLIGARYAARCPRPTPEATARRVAILRIDIEALSGKECKPAE